MEVGKIYKTKNGLSVLIESKEDFFSKMPWDFTGRDTTFKKYLHYSTNGECREGDEYSIEFIGNTQEGDKMKQDMPKEIWAFDSFQAHKRSFHCTDEKQETGFTQYTRQDIVEQLVKSLEDIVHKDDAGLIFDNSSCGEVWKSGDLDKCMEDARTALKRFRDGV